MEDIERKGIESALREVEGQVSRACVILGISRRALYERMKKYGLDRKDFMKS
jgi:two-component system C4-dicarboxylate transport response regulator DctD